MKLGLLSGCLGINSDDDQLPEILRRHADRFVRAGGVITLAEWAGLSEDEREVLIAAHDALIGGDYVGNALEDAVSP